MISLSINAILLAAVANITIGMAWYGPLFGTQWKQLAGVSDKKLTEDQGMSKEAGFAIITALIIAGMLDAANSLLGITSWLRGALLAGTICVGFVFTTEAHKVLWLDEAPKLYMLDMAHFFVSFAAMGAITALL